MRLDPAVIARAGKETALRLPRLREALRQHCRTDPIVLEYLSRNRRADYRVCDAVDVIGEQRVIALAATDSLCRVYFAKGSLPVGWGDGWLRCFITTEILRAQPVLWRNEIRAAVLSSAAPAGGFRLGWDYMAARDPIWSTFETDSQDPEERADGGLGFLLCPTRVPGLEGESGYRLVMIEVLRREGDQMRFRASTAPLPGTFTDRDPFAGIVKMVAFMDSPYLAHETASVPRTMRRRSQLAPPLVRMITLRRLVADSRCDETETPQQIEWSCRWIVRGHFRQQPRGKGRSERHPIWIAPYVKGPEDRPIKPPTPTAYRVAR